MRRARRSRASRPPGVSLRGSLARLERELALQQITRRGLDVAHPHLGGLLADVDLAGLALLALVVELDLVGLLVRIALLRVVLLLLLRDQPLDERQVRFRLGPVGSPPERFSVAGRRGREFPELRQRVALVVVALGRVDACERLDGVVVLALAVERDAAPHWVVETLGRGLVAAALVG